MVGGGHLEVERSGREPIRVYFSSTLEPKFSEVAEGINQLKADEPLALATRLERSHCIKCGRALPEKDGKCPACTRKLDTLRRLVGYMAPWGYPFNRSASRPHQCSAADRHGRFAPGRSRLVGCPRRLGGSGGSFPGRRLAMRSWKRIGSWATASSSTR